MLSKNQIKFILKLRQKKHRNEFKLFIVEGVKVVNEFLKSTIKLHALYCTRDIVIRYKEYYPQIISEKELLKISGLSTPNKVLAIFKIPDFKKIESNDLILALDGIRDPGNLGTIIRLCDWFGLSQIICTTNTVDCYNQKVVQASMGSLSRVSILYTDLENYIGQTKLPVYGAVMDGESIPSTKLNSNAILIMGSESHGISKTLLPFIQQKLTISKFNKNTVIDSLNVATATAILLYEFRNNT